MKSVLAVVLILVSSFISISKIAENPSEPKVAVETATPSTLGSALQWLAHNESSDGSYGAYLDHWTASAAYALWLNDSASSKARLAYSWLAQQINSSAAWYWGAYGEADVPGFVLFSISSSHHPNLIQMSSVASNLLQFQNPSGGFRGYYDPTLQSSVASSVDTDMALLGLVNAGEITAQGQENAVNYLLSLQNPDGSFNLTSSRQFDPIYSLGPDLTSTTAVTLLALKSLGLARDNHNVSKALTFLNYAVSSNFNGGGHVFAAAASALALKAYDQSDNAVKAILYILAQQNNDGGFSDVSRSSHLQSNALDTGWGALALEVQFSEDNLVTQVNSSPVASFVFDPTTISVGTTVHFDAGTSHDPDGDSLTYSWTFGDGSTATGVNPSHVYDRAGSFTVTLTTIDSGSNPPALSNTKRVTLAVQSVTVQNASSLPLSPTQLGAALTVAAAVILLTVYRLVRRKTGMKEPTLPAGFSKARGLEPVSFEKLSEVRNLVLRVL